MTDKVQKIREEVARIQLYTQSETLKQILDYIDEVQKEPVSKIWHDVSETPDSNKVVLTIVKCGCFGNPGIPHLAKYDSWNNQFITVDRTDVSNRPILYSENKVEKWAYINDLLNLTTKEEPASEDLEAEIERINKNNHFDFSDWKAIARHFANWQKEKDSVSSKDLEELIDTLSKRYPEVSFAKLSRIAVRVAKWQKKQDKETIELAEDHAMLAGIIKGTEHTIGNVRSILNKIAYRNNGLDVNGDYCEQRYVELDEEFKKLLKED